jgi:acyl-coenzyme A thioesterase PaaI-like protein
MKPAAADPAAAGSLQERFAAGSRCFGCGPANAHGLRIRTFRGDEPRSVVTRWHARPDQEAFDGVVNGGICATLLDCTMNWAAISSLVADDAGDAPDTVTADLAVRYLAPTPSDRPLRITARVLASDGRRVSVEGAIEAGGSVTATGTGTFVVVGPNHAASGRWRRSRT